MHVKMATVDLKVNFFYVHCPEVGYCDLNKVWGK